MITAPMRSALPLALCGLLAIVLGFGSGAARAAKHTDPAEAVVTAALKAALANDFDAYLATVHPSEKATEQQRQEIARFTFARVVRNAKWYVKGGDPDSFVVDRREDMGGGKVRVFVKDLAHASRAPVPVSLGALPGGGFGILANSL